MLKENTEGYSSNLPRRLKAVSEHLRETYPETQAIRYYIDTWQRYLGDDPDLLALAERFPRHITRANLATLAREGYEHSELRRRTFLATMLLGYGTFGRGPWRTVQMLESNGLQDTLDYTFAQVADGNLMSAYDRMSIKWCGPAFITKFIYVVGLAINADSYPTGQALLPLVLDRRVAKSLTMIHHDGDIVLSEYVRFGPGDTVSRFSSGWVRYVKLLDTWAKDIGCRADSIELMLFEPPHSFLDSSL